MERDENGAINIGWNAILKLMNYIITPKATSTQDDPKDKGVGGKRKRVDQKDKDSKIKPSSQKINPKLKGRSSKRKATKDSDGGGGGGGGGGGELENLHSIVVTSSFIESPMRVKLNSPQ